MREKTNNTTIFLAVVFNCSSKNIVFLPPFKIGVYAVPRVKDNGMMQLWICNYKTMEPEMKAILECHLFDFNENIYYQKVVIAL